MYANQSITVDLRPNNFWKKVAQNLGLSPKKNLAEELKSVLGLREVRVWGYDSPEYGYAYFAGIKEDGTPIRGDLSPNGKGVYAVVLQP